MKYVILKHCSWNGWTGTPGGDATAIPDLPAEVVERLVVTDSIRAIPERVAPPPPPPQKAS